MQIEETIRTTPKIGWESLETATKLENQKERKIRKAGNFAILGIPAFSVSFIVLFFVIGFSYSFANS